MNPQNIRLLVVDDSVYMQMAIRAMVGVYPEIEIVGEANDGEQAVEMAARLKPDVITMDVNMPGVNGLEATRRIAASAPVPIIMLSSLTEKGVKTTFQALEAGAVDYVAKSSSAIDVDLATIAGQMVEKIRFWGKRNNAPHQATDEALPTVPAGADLLLIAAGAGGPALVRELLHGIAPLPLPVLIAQDMPPSFTVPFVDFLARTTGHPIREAIHGGMLEAGTVTVMPGGRDGKVLRQANGTLTLDLGRASTSSAPPADIIVAAAGAAHSPVVVVLSGEARPLDRLPAAFAGKKNALWIQAPQTCVAEGLPRAVLTTGLQAAVLEPKQLAAALRSGFGRLMP